MLELGETALFLKQLGFDQDYLAEKSEGQRKIRTSLSEYF
jgi:hypothetical protein